EVPLRKLVREGGVRQGVGRAGQPHLDGHGLLRSNNLSSGKRAGRRRQLSESMREARTTAVLGGGETGTPRRKLRGRAGQMVLAGAPTLARTRESRWQGACSAAGMLSPQILRQDAVGRPPVAPRLLEEHLAIR